MKVKVLVVFCIVSMVSSVVWAQCGVRSMGGCGARSARSMGGCGSRSMGGCGARNSYEFEDDNYGDYQEGCDSDSYGETKTYMSLRQNESVWPTPKAIEPIWKVQPKTDPKMPNSVPRTIAPTPKQPEDLLRLLNTVIILHVPDGAVVTINDKAMKTTGEYRKYTFTGEQNRRYRFQIHVSYDGNEYAKDVMVRTGERRDLALDNAPILASY